MIYLISAVYAAGIIGAVMLIRKRSMLAIPVIAAVIGIDLILGGTALSSHLASAAAEYSGASYIGLSFVLLLTMLIV
ncbi:hypothetical protein [Peribacillus sp. SCS-37]|uniref:hypothetical protein n=1 Tax=Paraperibacillus esterisolvens TaxID=3115296 RepID=UPI0039061863